jgi:23S rRNA pseudouridine2605 synthase
MKNTIFALPEVKKIKQQSNTRLYPIGRLDKDTSGLLIITNDGDFANTIMHPRYEIEKSYIVTLHKPIIKRDLQKIREGVIVDKQKTWPAKAQRLQPTIVRLTIHEGRNRLVRRMFQALGYTVICLQRISMVLCSWI